MVYVWDNYHHNIILYCIHSITYTNHQHRLLLFSFFLFLQKFDNFIYYKMFILLV